MTGDVIVLLGLPGSGKGTQAIALASRGYVHVSTGDLFRNAIAMGNELGATVRDFVASGALVPDDVTIRVLFDRLEHLSSERVVIDGFPRNVDQAKALVEWLASRGQSLEALLIDVPDVALISRLSGRLICKAAGHPHHGQLATTQSPNLCPYDGSTLIRRDDDEPAVALTRLVIQGPTLAEVATYLDTIGVLHRVDGELPVADLTAAILKIVRPGPVASLPTWVHPDLSWILGVPPEDT